MGDNGFTGLDIERARHDVLSFKDSCLDIHMSIRNAVTNLFDVLNKKWGSSNAVNFTTDFLNDLDNLMDEYVNTYNHIYSGACNAASQLAQANGDKFPLTFDDLSGREWGVELGLSPCQPNINGHVGMDTFNVTLAKDIFYTKMTEVVNKLEAIPSAIAFYDPSGEMITSYGNALSSFKDRFSELIDAAKTKLDSYVITEENNLNLAKQNVVGEFKANA